MSNIVYRLFPEKIGGSTANNFIGVAGEMFYDPDTGNLRVSDGATPGGKPTSSALGSKTASVNRSITAADAGGMIIASGVTLTIAADATLNLPITTAVTIVAGASSVAITSTATLWGVGTGTSQATWTIPARSIGTIVKTAADTWYVAANGLS